VLNIWWIWHHAASTKYNYPETEIKDSIVDFEIQAPDGNDNKIRVNVNSGCIFLSSTQMMKEIVEEEIPDEKVQEGEAGGRGGKERGETNWEEDEKD